MTIQFTTTTTGQEIANALADDHEELAYCLLELANQKPAGLVEGLDETLYGSDRNKVADFLIAIGNGLKAQEL